MILTNCDVIPNIYWEPTNGLILSSPNWQNLFWPYI